MNKRIKIGSNNIAYQVYGSGKKMLLAFHGFGQSANYYEVFGDVLGDVYTVFSVDLLYHGNTKWKDREVALEKEDWAQVIDQLLAYENIDRFSIAGYSLGGKYTLATIEQFADKIDEVFFIAPDGIKTSFWYSLATYPDWLRNYFRYMIFKPQYFYSVMQTFQKFRIMDKGIEKFAHNNMDNRKKRLKVYNSWVVTVKLHFDMKKIANMINKKGIKTTFYLGRFDKIITRQNMSRLSKYLKHKEVVILETGHNKLIEYTAHYLADKKEG